MEFTCLGGEVDIGESYDFLFYQHFLMTKPFLIIFCQFEEGNVATEEEITSILFCGTLPFIWYKEAVVCRR